jgi:beta-lactamase regulating signal transducer with metallopeptidase domain
VAGRADTSVAANAAPNTAPNAAPNAAANTAPNTAPNAVPSSAPRAAPGMVRALSAAPIIPILAAAWMCGVLVLSIRLLGGWCWLYRRLGRHARPAPSEWQWRLDALARPLGVAGRVRLLVSESVNDILALGWLRPAVLLPASALLRLSPEALEAILAHELAHIARRDFAVNLLQSAAEVLFFYHPAAWWLSGQIRELREYCCDDAAAAQCQSRASYAGALADLETLRAECPPQLAPAAKGASLMKRIQRLIGAPPPAASGLRSGFVSAAAVLVLGTGALWGLAPDGGRRPERQVIVIKEAGRSLRVQTEGAVDLGRGALDGAALEDGAAIVIAERENGVARRLAVRREGGEVKKTYSVNGEPKAIDAAAEAWIGDKAAAIGQAQSYVSKLGAGGGEVSFKVEEEGKEGEGAKVIVYSNRRPFHMRLGPGVEAAEAWGTDDIGDLGGFPIDAEGLATDLKGISVLRLKDLDALKSLDDLDALKALEGLEGLEDLDALKSLKGLKGLDALKSLDGLKGLHHPPGLHVFRLGPDGGMLDLDLDFDFDLLEDLPEPPEPPGPPRPFDLSHRPRARFDLGPDHRFFHGPPPGKAESSQERKERLQRRMDALQRRMARLQEEMDGLESR